LAFIPSLIIFVWLYFKKQKSANWSKICDTQLLEHFLVQNGKTASRYPSLLLLLTWLVTTFALAGPSWEKVKSPIFTNQDALIIILDLSQSMNASDLKPSRIQRAKHKISDLLNQRQEGQTALLVYAGDTHIVSPLTPDNKTISSFISVLDSSLMPVSGSNLNAALEKAKQLFINSGISYGQILLLTDGIQENQKEKLMMTISDLKKSSYILSIMGIGTVDGAPIPSPQVNEQNSHGFIKDINGNIVLSKLNESMLKQLAQSNQGKYHRMTLTNTDLEYLVQKPTNNFKYQEKHNKDKNDSQTISQQQWLDKGSLFVFLVLPFALLLFRKGWAN